MKRPPPNPLVMASLLLAGLQGRGAHEPSDHLGPARVGAGPVPAAAHHNRSPCHYPPSPLCPVITGLFGQRLIANYLVLYLLVALWLPGIYVIVRPEEKELRDRFGLAYDEYSRRCPAFCFVSPAVPAIRESEWTAAPGRVR